MKTKFYKSVLLSRTSFAALLLALCSTVNAQIFSERIENFSDNEIIEIPAAPGVISESGNDFSTTAFVARTTASIASAGIGGKELTDKYLLVSRTAVSASNDYFAFSNNADLATENSSLPLTVEFSLYLSQTQSTLNFIIGFAMYALDNTATGPLAGALLVTDPARATVGSNTGSTRYYVAPQVWHRIKITMYPGTSNTKIWINGTLTEMALSSTWGERFNQMRFALPNSVDLLDYSFAVDDLRTYRGTEVSTSNFNLMNSSTNNALTVFPVPFKTGQVNMRLNGEINNDTKIKILNVAGVEIYSANVTASNVTVDRSSLSSGVYVVVSESKGKMIGASKLIVQ